jgi:tetratricopeptide (TPR) repeat protein
MSKIFTLIFLCFHVNCFSSELEAKQGYELARKYYQEARSIQDPSIQEQKFADAEVLLKKSLSLWEHALIAYFLAITNYQLKDYTESQYFAKKAMDIAPPRIDDKYLPSIQKLLDYSSEPSPPRSRSRSIAVMMIIDPEEFEGWYYIEPSYDFFDIPDSIQ